MPSSIIKSFAKKTGKSIEEVESLWDKAQKIAQKKGLSKDPDSFFAFATGVLKRMLKLEKNLNKDPEDLVEGYMDGTSHRIRSEPIGSASTIFKRDKFLRRRSEKDKKKKSYDTKKKKVSKDIKEQPQKNL